MNEKEYDSMKEDIYSEIREVLIKYTYLIENDIIDDLKGEIAIHEADIKRKAKCIQSQKEIIATLERENETLKSVIKNTLNIE